MNTYKVTYTIQGLLRVFVDVVTAENEDECVTQIQMLAFEFTGIKQINVVLIVVL